MKKYGIARARYLIFGQSSATFRLFSEFGVQEFDRVMVERRCHVILNEGNLSAFHFWEGIITKIAVFSTEEAFTFGPLQERKYFQLYPV